MEGYCVYKHTAPNGKVYIGITCKNPLYRWNNGNGYKNSPHFWNAIRKYGWDAFRHEVLLSGLTHESAEAMEIEYIAFYDSTNPNNGYNIEAGGNAGRPLSIETRKKISATKRGRPGNRAGATHTAEAREKLRIANTGKPISDEVKEKISLALTGRVFSEEHKQNMSAAKKLQWENAEFRAKRINNSQSKSVINLDTGEVFPSISEAIRVYKCSTIWNACHGLNKTAAGCRWAIQ